VLDFRYEALPGRVVFGAGAARRELVGEADRLGAHRLLLVATEQAAALARELVAPLGDRVVGTFLGVRPHVPAEVAAAARQLASDVRADALLSVGGGSTTGTAKAVALTTGLPILAVPTTYAGSEVTSVWGMTERTAGGTGIGTDASREASRKRTGTDPKVLPRTVVYDPELTLSLPAGLSAASGLNALAHCVEAFWAPRRNPISTLAAEEGIRALSGALPAVQHNPRDLDGRAELLYGAYLASSAFAVAGSGLHHKICHVLGGAYDLPHAQTHAVVLPHVLAFNAPAAPQAARRIARALGVADPVVGLRALTAELGIPDGLRALGMRAEQVDQAAALVEPTVPADNPRHADRAALRDLTQAAWVGTGTALSAGAEGERTLAAHAVTKEP
jgi:maleylacetate reductase